jgi:uncharacterized protein (DUF4213/DUF364 family)
MEDAIRLRSRERLNFKPRNEGGIDENQGYAILQSVEFSDGRGGVVLAHNPDAANPFVTWKFKRTENGSREYELGHYFNEKCKAEADFMGRVKDEIEDGREVLELPDLELDAGSYEEIFEQENYHGELRSELSELFARARACEREINELTSELEELKQSENGGALVKTAAVIEDKIRELREKLAELQRRIVELAKKLVAAIRGNAQTSMQKLQSDFDKTKTDLAKVGGAINNVRNDIKSVILPSKTPLSEIKKAIEKGSMLDFNQKLAAVDKSDLPKVFEYALLRGDKIGIAMAETLVKNHTLEQKQSYEKADKFAQLKPGAVLKRLDATKHQRSINWLLGRRETLVLLQREESGEILYAAAKSAFPERLSETISRISSDSYRQTALQLALRECLKNHDIRAASALMQAGADVGEFSDKIAQEDMEERFLTKQDRAFMNKIGEKWNDMESEQDLEQDGEEI